MKVKLLISSQHFWPTHNGVAHVAQELAGGLSQRNFDVIVTTPRLPGQPEQEWWGPVKVVRVQQAGQGTLISRYGGDIRRYRQVLCDADADIYLFLCWESWMVDTAVPFFHHLRGRKVLASHGTSAYWRPPGLKGWGRRALWLPHALRYSWLLPKFDHFVLLTGIAQKERFYDKILLDQLGIRTWSVIPNGTHWEQFLGNGASFRTHHGIDDRLLMLYVANYSWGKNQEALLRVFENAQIENAVLVLIGSEINDYARTLQRRYGKRDALKGHVLFLANQSQESIREAYCAADLFVSTSLTEAQPLVILDAMASATPFLATNVGCVSELPGGIVAQSEQELVQNLRLLAADRALRERLGAAGRQACIEQYNWVRTVQSYDELFKHLLASAGEQCHES